MPLQRQFLFFFFFLLLKSLFISEFPRSSSPLLWTPPAPLVSVLCWEVGPGAVPRVGFQQHPLPELCCPSLLSKSFQRAVCEAGRPLSWADRINLKSHMVEELTLPSQIAPCMGSDPQLVSCCHLTWVSSDLRSSLVFPEAGKPQQLSCPCGGVILTSFLDNKAHQSLEEDTRSAGGFPKCGATSPWPGEWRCQQGGSSLQCLGGQTWGCRSWAALP